MALKYCTICGEAIQPDTRFCKGCGQSLMEQDSQEIQDAGPIAEVGISHDFNQGIPKALGHYVSATPSSGEMIFTQVFASQNVALTETIGPFKTFWRTIGKGFRGFSTGLKDMRILISTLLLMAVWIGLAVLKYFGEEAPLFNMISMITFAEGGYNAGMAGIIGGVIGKGIVGGVIILVLSQILSFKNPFAGIFKSLGLFFKSIAVKSLKDLSVVIMGLGLALVLYNFMSGVTSTLSAAVGVAGFILAMKAFKAVNRLLAGFCLGFLLSVALSITPQSYLVYALGGALLILGVVLNGLSRLKKGAKANA